MPQSTNYMRGNTPTQVVPSYWDATGNSLVPTTMATPLPVTTSEALVTPAGATVCSNVATGASAIVAAASATRKEVIFNNTGSVNINLNNGAAADANKFILLPGQPLTLSSSNGLAQREWRAYSAAPGNLSLILVEA